MSRMAGPGRLFKGHGDDAPAGSQLRLALDVSAVPSRPAGAGQYTVGLVCALAKRDDVALTLICRHGDDGRWLLLAPGAAVVAASPGPRPARLLWEQSGLPLILRGLDVEVHHGPHYTMPELAHLPRVVTIHDLTFYDHPEWHERSKVVVFRRAIRVAARRADALVCVSEATGRRFTELFSPRGPIHVIPHGVDQDRFRPLSGGADGPQGRADAAILERLGIRAPFVAFVGTIEPRKAVSHLVRAFDRMASAHPDLRLVLAGGDGWGTDEVTHTIATSRHRDRVVRTGYVSDQSVPALLRQAAAVAYPSQEEGFGLPALEALACGAPLVTTAGSAMEEVVGEAGLLVPAGDVAALAGALDMLVRGDQRLAQRRSRGVAIAARYTWEACAEGHMRVYRSVVRPRSGR
jgi:glycosyltransferase involved in cell wall biosynthesis